MVRLPMPISSFVASTRSVVRAVAASADVAALVLAASVLAGLLVVYLGLVQVVKTVVIRRYGES